jgi:hypothetical protein
VKPGQAETTLLSRYHRARGEVTIWEVERDWWIAVRNGEIDASPEDVASAPDEIAACEQILSELVHKAAA